MVENHRPRQPVELAIISPVVRRLDLDQFVPECRCDRNFDSFKSENCQLSNECRINSIGRLTIKSIHNIISHVEQVGTELIVSRDRITIEFETPSSHY